MKNTKYYILKISIITFTIIVAFFMCSKMFTIDSIRNEKNIKSSIDYKIVEKIDKMTLDEKIGQMILSGFNGTCFNKELSILINDFKVGGIILFSRNIEDSKQLKKLTSDIIGINQDIPLFISIDEEGGRVSRLPKDIKKFESSKSIGDRGDEKYAYENGREIGGILKNYNINMNFAPVLDIYSNPKNTVIGDRAFGDNEKVVSSMGIATMKGLRDENIIPVVKHFPGHGDTEIDSHLGLPIVEKNLKQLNELELIPFNKAIENGVGAVMVSHILIKEIDDKYPATLSYTLINDILRNNMKFENIVITDDMLMKAITDCISIEEASVKSIKAGADIILIGSDINKTKSVIERIKLAVANNEISEGRIDKSVYRILKQKETL
ncbi:MAG: beta-N-acetylhexosaminidase [Paraclostridium bifermentans]|uniref:beta-N-acetylhexosaminidase n=1 Tax=Paraclostridium bifermentans TaxID=1490 RepID=UPI00241FD9AA|nr:beta-N-acetylhexosaminidase [Paraclostridium bifermentans]MBS5954070.1 beta-N-acetylhexosaminidase [Paraclostridium bifermentans]